MKQLAGGGQDQRPQAAEVNVRHVIGDDGLFVKINPVQLRSVKEKPAALILQVNGLLVGFGVNFLPYLFL